MAWPKGVPRPPNSGRKKGTPNKKTELLQQKLERHNYDPIDALVALIPELDPKSKAHVALELMQYVYPKRKAIELNDVTQEPKNYVFNISWGDDVIDTSYSKVEEENPSPEENS